MAAVEDHARRLVLRVVGRLRFLVPAQGLLDLRRESRAQPVRLGDEVGERGGRVGEDERAQPGGLRERVLLAEEPAPGLAEDVVAVGDPERVDEVVQLADEQVDRPEVGAAVRVVRAAAVAELVVVDDGPAVGEIGEREEVVVGRAWPAVKDDERRGRRGRRAAGRPSRGTRSPPPRRRTGRPRCPRAHPQARLYASGLSTSSTASTAACVRAPDHREWSDPDTGDTHPTQGAGTFGGRGIRALSRPTRSVSRADAGRPQEGRATPDSTHARAGGAPSLTPADSS